MSESSTGLSEACTRQNAGSDLNAFAGRRDPSGGENSPAATLFAEVIVTCGKAVETKLSQDAGAPAATRPESATTARIFTGVVILPAVYQMAPPLVPANPN